MALAHQIRIRRREKGLSLAELARLAQISKGYLHRLEHDVDGVHPSADVICRIAFALGTSVGELLEKQLKEDCDDVSDVPEELRKLALAEHLLDEDIKVLARIEYRGRQPRTMDDWKFLYESIKRSVGSES